VVEKGFAHATGAITDRVGRIPKQVWMTEGSGVSGRIGNGLYQKVVHSEEDVIASSDQSTRFVVSLLANGVKKVFLYSMHAHSHFGRASEWRVLVTEDGYPHPSAAAHAAMAWHLESRQFVERVKLAEEVYGYVFAGPDGRVTVIAGRPGANLNYTLPKVEGARYADLFGNPLAPGSKLGRTVVYWSDMR
jgi:hypothetical protein